ncbi:DUF2062 domain-containing protein [Tamlana sp. 2201CG12-4]|uniref:DUF2062 domain-containing protein n=1 Tax=Tamlana sp. 2201CG12-4 TaxID=3112582 RepID=UPI002DBBB64D|nr:DUF2062 domain-containing protein [Tamlana sp. 2201CG12-4]MEC3908123.1 DUF2062 domain-containing protein [Tamlana sp. 2201CG12-4]
MKNPINLFKGLFKLEDSPKVIAKGFALGSFIGMIPIPGFQIFVAFGISKFLKVNTKAACIAVFNTNLFTGAFIFAFNYWLGKKVLGISSSFEMPKTINMQFANTILKAGTDVYISLVVGGVITGILFAFASYYILKQFIENRQLKTKEV